MSASTVENPDGSSTIYVHHLCEGGAAVAPAPQAQQAQVQQAQVVFGAPFGVACSPPPPAPAFASWGMPSVPSMPSWTPFGQPSVVVMTPPKPKEEKKEKTDEEKKKEWEEEWNKKAEKEKKKKEDEAKAKKKKEEDEKRKKEVEGAREMSRASAASVVFFCFALALGSSTIIMTYLADRERRAGTEAGVPPEENDQYLHHRTVALGLTCAFAACHAIATVAAFVAALRTRDVIKRREKCVESTFVIAGWIIFLLAFTMNVFVLIMALNKERLVHPSNIVIVVVLSVVSYVFMFGYSEMTRRW